MHERGGAIYVPACPESLRSGLETDGSPSRSLKMHLGPVMQNKHGQSVTQSVSLNDRSNIKGPPWWLQLLPFLNLFAMFCFSHSLWNQMQCPAFDLLVFHVDKPSVWMCIAELCGAKRIISQKRTTHFLLSSFCQSQHPCHTKGCACRGASRSLPNSATIEAIPP